MTDFMPREKWHLKNHRAGRFIPVDECWECGRDKAVCHSKVTYPDPRTANDSALGLNMDRGWVKPLAPYRCRECGLWHLTSNETRLRRSRWRKQQRRWAVPAEEPA